MIRVFQNKDLEKVLQIWLEENIKAHHFIPEEYWKKNYDDVKAVLPNAELYVYTYNDAISGFIGLNDNHIEGIFVKSESQHNGIGTALLNQAKRGHTELTLNVYEKNKNAFHFYLKNGFKTVDEKTDTETGEKEYTMLWECDCLHYNRKGME